MVTRQIGVFLDSAPNGDLRVVSACAGQGLDLIGALKDHVRAPDVSALLVESDHRNIEQGRALAARPGLTRLTFVEADAGALGAYASHVPAQLVLLCGVFGNVSDSDVHRTVTNVRRLCAEGATVIWTRHRNPPDLTPQIRAWFEAEGFVLVDFTAPPEDLFTVGTVRLKAPPKPFEDRTIFRFVR